MNELDTDILKLQSIGYNLDSININGYFVIGIFKNKNYIKEISIPFYKINEDIFDQLESLIEGYNTYILEGTGQIYEKGQIRIKGKELIDFNSNKIDWDKVYNSKIYVQIALNTTIELLFWKLNKELKAMKYFHRIIQN